MTGGSSTGGGVQSFTSPGELKANAAGTGKSGGGGTTGGPTNTAGPQVFKAGHLVRSNGGASGGAQSFGSGHFAPLNMPAPKIIKAKAAKKKS